ncbi:MAG: hypothetical protein R2991_15175 [Thermoanaerobaculia bacterium]
MRRVLPALGLVSVVLSLAAPCGAAEPFYDNLLTEGQLAYARGDWAAAAQRFRIACFGLLEEPARLADCRTRLALTEARLGQRERFEDAFRQILDLERRFGAYGDAEIPAEMRSDFEAQVARWIPEEVLRDVPAFASVARQRTLDRLASLPPSQRRIEIGQLAAAEPNELRWPLELARLAIADRSWLTAQEWTTRALEIAPGYDEALCLRGRAAAMGARCGDALPDLAHCAAPPADSRLVEDQLSCHLALGDLDGAETLIAALPPDVRESRPIRKAAKGIEKTREALAREAARSGSDAAPVAQSPPSESAPDTAEAGTTARTVTSEEITRLRAGLLSAGDYPTLAGIYERAEQLAEASPDWIAAQRLAGEAAYRTSQWERSVHFLQRSRLDAEAPPSLAFYLAVSLYESGEPTEAARILRQVLPRLENSAVVRSYSERILGEDG